VYTTVYQRQHESNTAKATPRRPTGAAQPRAPSCQTLARRREVYDFLPSAALRPSVPVPDGAVLAPLASSTAAHVVSPSRTAA